MRKLTLQVPCSTSNLGPGFDCLGLALAQYCYVTIFLLENNDPSIPFINFKGQITKDSESTDIDFLLYKVLKSFWKGNPDLLQRVRLEISSDIPLGAGLGGSSAAILGALWGSYIFQDRIPNLPDLLAEASILEGHSESFAASLLGNFVICARSQQENQIIAKQLSWPERWKTIFVIPEYRLQTDALRACLPKSVPFADACFNLQRVALLMSAVIRNDDAMLKESMQDRLHEQYRLIHTPLLLKVRQQIEELPTLGSCLSGAGPSVLVLTSSKHEQEVLQALQEWALGEDEKLNIISIDIDREGLKELSSIVEV